MWKLREQKKNSLRVVLVYHLNLAAALRPYVTLYAIDSVFTLKREISTKTTSVAKRGKKKGQDGSSQDEYIFKS